MDLRSGQLSRLIDDPELLAALTVYQPKLPCLGQVPFSSKYAVSIRMSVSKL
jgi:hypothetical protein